MSRRTVLLAIALTACFALRLFAVRTAFSTDAVLRFPNPDDASQTISGAVQGGRLMLEVTDADLNIPTDKTILAYAECVNNAVIQYDRFTTSSLNVVTSSDPIAAPILDRNSDGVVNFQDVISSSGTLQVQSVDGVNGSITVRCLAVHGDGVLGGNDCTHFTLTYRHTLIDTTAMGTGLGSVKVASDADVVGVTVRLEETSPNTGVFRGVVFLSASASTTSTFRCLIASFACSLGSTTTTPPLGQGRTADGIWSVGDLRVNAVDMVVLSYVDGSSVTPITRTATILVDPSAAPTPTPTLTPTPTPTPSIEMVLNAYAECSSNSLITLDRFTPSIGAVVTSSAPITPPILDRNSDGVVSFADVISSSATLQVQAVDGVNGSIYIRCTVAHGDGVLGGNDGTHFTLTYKQRLPTPTPVPFFGGWALVLLSILFSTLALWRMTHLPRP